MVAFDRNQYFIVTGASSGIGKGIALLLNELGASVVAIARRRDRLVETRECSKYPDRFYCEQKDLASDIENIPDYVKNLKGKYGKFQGLVCSAGIGEIRPLSSTRFHDLQHVFNINYFSPILMLKGFLDRRINNGKGSSAVMLSSAAAVVFDRGHTAYSGSKAALCASCASIAKEVANAGVRVNCILPSDIQTPMTDAMANLRDDPSSKYPFGIGKVSDVANMVVFLLSDKAKWITGQNYVIDCASF